VVKTFVYSLMIAGFWPLAQNTRQIERMDKRK